MIRQPGTVQKPASASSADNSRLHMSEAAAVSSAAAPATAMPGALAAQQIIFEAIMFTAMGVAIAAVYRR
jgi:hypothetical protein